MPTFLKLHSLMCLICVVSLLLGGREVSAVETCSSCVVNRCVKAPSSCKVETCGIANLSAPVDTFIDTEYLQGELRQTLTLDRPVPRKAPRFMAVIHQMYANDDDSIDLVNREKHAWNLLVQFAGIKENKTFQAEYVVRVPEASKTVQACRFGFPKGFTEFNDVKLYSAKN